MLIGATLVEVRQALISTEFELVPGDGAAVGCVGTELLVLEPDEDGVFAVFCSPATC